VQFSRLSLDWRLQVEDAGDTPVDWITCNEKIKLLLEKGTAPSSTLKIPTGLGVGSDVLDTNAGDVR